jgi:hypothetical protein
MVTTSARTSKNTAVTKTTKSSAKNAPKSVAKPKSAGKTASNKSNKTVVKEDAISLLIADHDKVKKMFKKYDKLEDLGQKKSLAEEICTELTVHTKVEEEIFYPASRPKIKDDDMMDEAIIEHATAKDLIAQIQSMNPNDPMYDAKVTVLGEYIDHHVKEEQEEMFPKVRKAKLDLIELGQRIKMRKQELLRSLAH